MKYIPHLLNQALGPKTRPARCPLIPTPVPLLEIPLPWSGLLLETTDIPLPLPFQHHPASFRTTNFCIKPTLDSIRDSCILRTVFRPSRLRPGQADAPPNNPLRTFTRAPSTVFSCMRTPKPATKHYLLAQKTNPSANGTFRHLNSLGLFTASTWAAF